MKDEDFEGIKAGLEDAIAFVRGDASRAAVHLAVDIKAMRMAMGKTQTQFAKDFRIPVGTVRDWEQGRRSPDAPARALLKLIAADPAGVERVLAG